MGLESEVFHKPGMCQDAGQLSIYLHHFINLLNLYTFYIIESTGYVQKTFVLVLQNLQTLNVYWQSNGKLSSTPVMLPLYMTWRGLALPLGTLNRRYVAETNLKSPVLPDQ